MSLMTCCRDDDVAEVSLPVPIPWDPFVWYQSVYSNLELRWQKNHPVSGNLTCMSLALQLALQQVKRLWLRKFDEKATLIVDHERIYPYFANNVFTMRTDRYLRVIGHKDCCRGTDEVMMNQLLREEAVPLCFIKESFGIHPAWGNFGQAVKHRLEIDAAQALSLEFPWIRARVPTFRYEADHDNARS
eukprot:TRINITY_DN10885_c2_g1_i1.p1 TRINITY_DN10885_c2_g1~~TRINITY_DN10885_c2_g1_i1.p1  ORF type:complete len:188 (+),score=27.48 TRINITY_DN10885_c2_g1_i1:2-565(+)